MQVALVAFLDAACVARPILCMTWFIETRKRGYVFTCRSNQHYRVPVSAGSKLVFTSRHGVDLPRNQSLRC